jgi:hypothetical protein
MMFIKNRQRYWKSGVSFVEMIIVVTITAGVIALSRVVVNMFNGFFQNSETAQVQRDVQLTLYNITKEIRNSPNIISAGGGQLQFNIFNTKLGYTNPNLFNSANLGTMTYQYERNGNSSHLRQTIQLPGQPVEEHLLLKNVLQEPDLTNYLFNACTLAGAMSGDRCPPNGVPPSTRIEAVDVRLTVSPLYVKDSKATYSNLVMRRNQWQ